MHVTIVNQVYWPHPAATSQLMTELAQGLVRRGARVSVVTAATNDFGRAPLRETVRGVEIHRVPTTRRGKKRLISRALDYGTFFAGASARLATLLPRPDVMLALTTPPLIAGIAQLVGAVRRVPVVSLVQDVYPDIAVALGVLPAGSMAHRAWRALAAKSLRASHEVVVLSEAMRRRIRAYDVPDARITTIHNWALAELHTAARGDAMRLKYGLGDRFVVMYSGNMGAGHSFDGVLAAAERLRDREDIAFVFVGEGVRKAEIAATVQARGLSNVRLFPYAPREALAESLSVADLHLVTMRDGVEGLLMPSKLYGILAVARPTLFVGPETSDVAHWLAQGQCGAACLNDDVDGIVDAITGYADDRPAAVAAGRAGRRLLDAEFDRDTAIDAYAALLQRTARRTLHAPASNDPSAPAPRAARPLAPGTRP